MRKLKSRKSSERVDAYFKKKDKLKKRKKIFFMSLACLVASIVFLFKAQMFAIKDFTVVGNKMVKKEGVLNKKITNGKNIFLLDTNEIENEVLKNPYIHTAEVSRKLPNQILIKITERKMFYKIKFEEDIYILNNGLYIMDIVKDDKDLALVELKGIKIESKKIGERITMNEKLAEIAIEIAQNLIDKNKESIFTLVDLTDIGDVSIYKDKIEIILGEVSNLDEKYKQAMDILNSKAIKFKAGYIDISVPSQPVIKESIEEKIDEPKEKISSEKKNNKSDQDSIKGNESIEEEKVISENTENETETNIQSDVVTLTEDNQNKDASKTNNLEELQEQKNSEINTDL
ncbi:MAG: cell division protein FtsQ/DivIB [Sarcina sp.]